MDALLSLRDPGHLQPLLRPTLPAAREGDVVGDVVGEGYVMVFVHECLLTWNVWKRAALDATLPTIAQIHWLRS